MTLRIVDGSANGFDLMPYIAQGGIKWSRNDVDGPNAGRTLDGTMERDRVATKYRWDVTCRPVTATEWALVLSAIQPETFLMEYTDPLDGTDKIAEYYSNNFPSTYLIQKSDGEDMWNGLAFPLIMV